LGFKAGQLGELFGINCVGSLSQKLSEQWLAKTNMHYEVAFQMQGQSNQIMVKGLISMIKVTEGVKEAAMRTIHELRNTLYHCIENGLKHTIERKKMA
jgi:hypothetical protein